MPAGEIYLRPSGRFMIGLSAIIAKLMLIFDFISFQLFSVNYQRVLRILQLKLPVRESITVHNKGYCELGNCCNGRGVVTKYYI